MTRQGELHKAVLSALREKPNNNGMQQHQPIPVSTRTRAEAQRTLNTPDVAPELRPASRAGTGCMHDYVAGTVRGRLEIATARKRDEPRLTPAQIERQRLTDFYYAEYQREQKAEADRKAAQELKERQRQEAVQHARRAKVEQARRNREIEAENARIVEQNQIRREIRRELADATPAEEMVVIERVRAEGCANFPAAYGIHLAALREETEAAIAAAAQKGMEEQ